jgi:hypothetical protein
MAARIGISVAKEEGKMAEDTKSKGKTSLKVTVTPGAASITTAESLGVTVAVSGGPSSLTPSGDVTLSAGSTVYRLRL